MNSVRIIKYSFIKIIMIAILLFGALLISGCSSSGDPSSQQTIRILLTNDDGIDADGIIAMYDALVASSLFDVVVIAPSEEQSGSSANITHEGDLTVIKRDDRHYAVDG